MYKAGQEVMRCEPFAHAIKNEYRTIVCDWCLAFKKKEGELKKCGQCIFVYYCNRTCQLNAWRSYHNLECKLFKFFSEMELTFRALNHNLVESILPTKNHNSVFLARILLKLKNGRDYVILPNGQKRFFKELFKDF